MHQSFRIKRTKDGATALYVDGFTNDIGDKKTTIVLTVMAGSSKSGVRSEVKRLCDALNAAQAAFYNGDDQPPRRPLTNPDFKPGVNCTRCRYGVLPEPKDKEYPYTCADCLPEVRAGMLRSKAAKRAVETKRRRYRAWPTRRNDHRSPV